jgi:hypothetical protein
METVAFFEKKLSLTPGDFNKVKMFPIDDLLLKKAKDSMENKCSEQGFILPGSIKLISRSMGYFEAARFTGDAIYYVKLEGTIIYPVDGIRINGEVIRNNKMGLYVDYKHAIRIQIPRDLHLGNQEYDRVKIGDIIQIELKRSKFAIHDAYILASGIFHSIIESGASPAKEDDKVEQVEQVEESEEEKHEVLPAAPAEVAPSSEVVKPKRPMVAKKSSVQSDEEAIKQGQNLRAKLEEDIDLSAEE